MSGEERTTIEAICRRLSLVRNGQEHLAQQDVILSVVRYHRPCPVLIGCNIPYQYESDSYVWRCRRTDGNTGLSENDASEDAIGAAFQVKDLPHVVEARLVTKEEALLEFKEMFKDSPQVIEGLGEDNLSLPAFGKDRRCRSHQGCGRTH